MFLSCCHFNILSVASGSAKTSPRDRPAVPVLVQGVIWELLGVVWLREWLVGPSSFSRPWHGQQGPPQALLCLYPLSPEPVCMNPLPALPCDPCVTCASPTNRSGLCLMAQNPEAGTPGE